MDSQSDSRKRPLETDSDDGMTKRSNQGQMDPNMREDVHLKMMVPSCAAGAVIGKGGETIGKIQRETGAKMKMSKNQDVFPGTTERVCLIVGTIHSCLAAHDEISQIVRDKPDPHPKPSADGDGKINYQRHQQTKFLVPNSSAGVIIGKAGAYIKEIKERSGAHVNVSPKSDNPERIVTVSGADKDEVRNAMTLILEKLAMDPQSSSYSSLNYSSMHSSMNGATPSNSFTSLSSGGLNVSSLTNGSMTPQQVQQAAQSLTTMMRAFTNLGSGINNLNISRPRNAILDQLVQTLKMTGYTDLAAEEIATALATLANYGVLNLTGGLLGNLMNLNRLSLNSNGASGSSSSGPGGNQSSSQSSGAIPSLLSNTEDDSMSLLRQLTQTLARAQNKSGGSGDLFGPVGSAKSESQDGVGSLFSSNSLFGLDSGGFGGQNQSGSPEPQETQEIEVAENIAGAIIGQQGRGITEIQQMTGASVSVSRRGVYAPGTNNRIVTISGPTSGVSRAATIVRQKIQDAEQRRAQSAY